MTDADLTKLFEKTNADPSLNRSFDFDETWKLVSERIGLDSANPQVRYGLRDYLEYATWQFTHSMLRPLGAAVAIFIFAITGFVSVANASGRALPGDELYRVKLGIEKVQLALAFRADSRASLQVEFASRRLEEMVVLAATARENAPESVELAVERFKSEVTTIKEELQEETGAQQKKELAKALGRQAGTYSSTVASTTTELSPEVRSEVTDIIEQTQEQAVEVIITAHEEAQDADTERELALALEVEVAEMRLVFGEVSSQVIETALALQAEGNYRRAFQVLKEFVLAHELEVLPQ